MAIAVAVLLSAGACGSATGNRSDGPQVVPFKLTPVERTKVERNQVPRREALAALKVSLEQVPKDVTFGNTVRFVAVLTNNSASGVSLRPCPVYVASYDKEGLEVFQASRLNCEAAPKAIGPNRSVRFEMKLMIEGKGIGSGFSGHLAWVLVSAPFRGENFRAFAGPIVVKGGPPPTQPDPHEATRRVLTTEGKMVGGGRFSFGPQPGRFGVFLEGSRKYPELRHAAVFDSGRMLCSESGSLRDSDWNFMLTATCTRRPFSLLFGVVPNDVVRVEVNLGPPGAQRVVTAELGPIGDDPKVRPMMLVHSSTELSDGLRGYRANGTVIEQ